MATIQFKHIVNSGHTKNTAENERDAFKCAHFSRDIMIVHAKITAKKGWCAVENYSSSFLRTLAEEVRKKGERESNSIIKLPKIAS